MPFAYRGMHQAQPATNLAELPNSMPKIKNFASMDATTDTQDKVLDEEKMAQGQGPP